MRSLVVKPAIDPAVEHQLLELLVHRAQMFADAVRLGEIGFLDAVYTLADAARDSGLADGVRDARLQRAIGFAFMGPLPKRANGRRAMLPQLTHDGQRPNRDGRKRRFTLTRFDQITPSTAGAYLVKGLIPRGGLIVVWGAPKCGKSFWTLDLAMHVARGVPYRGRRVKQGTVVYLALDGGEGFARRLEAYRQHHKVVDVPLYLIIRIDLIHDHRALIAAVREQVGDDGAPVMIIIDTLNCSLVGSESSDEDMSAYGRAAEAIREAFACAVTIVHHCGVDGTRPRGHTSLGAAVDALLAVTRDVEENVVVTVEAVRDGEDGEVIGSRLEKVEIGKDEDGDMMTSCVVLPVETDTLATGGRKETDLQRTFREAFTEALIVGGQMVRVRGDGPTIKAAQVEIVRQQFYARWATGEIDAKKRGNAQRQAFRRGLRGAKAAGYATWVHDDVEWLSDPRVVASPKRT